MSRGKRFESARRLSPMEQCWGTFSALLKASSRMLEREWVVQSKQRVLEQDPATDRDASPNVAASLVEHMASEIEHLREQLDTGRETNQENRRILAAGLERILAIESSPDYRIMTPLQSLQKPI
jgi:hypothetical protein